MNEPPEIRSAVPTFTKILLAHPFTIGKGTIVDVTLASVSVTAGDGTREEAGTGEVFLSPIWADPRGLPLAQKEQEMEAVLTRACTAIEGFSGNPLDAYWSLFPEALRQARSLNPVAPIPTLAVANAYAPLDAAVWDAAGRLGKRSSYTLSLPLDQYGGRAFAGTTSASLFHPPAEDLIVLHTVGLKDPLEGDNSLAEWMEKEGVYSFKVKLGGDPEGDATRVIAVARCARKKGSYVLTVDGNEKYTGTDALTVFLDKLEADDPEAYACLQFIEQPTPRTAEIDVHPIASRKPMVADESAATPDDVVQLAAQGWNGLALKFPAKSHSASVLSLARAREYGMYLTCQDLTNPPYRALQHHLLSAAHITGLAPGVEYNSRQYLKPDIFSQSPGDFSVHGGRVRVIPEGIGLY